MFRILKYLRKYWYFAILAPLFMILEVAMDMNVITCMGSMLDTVNSYSSDASSTFFVETIKSTGLEMLMFVFIGVVSGILSGVFANLASQKFANDLRIAVFNKIMHFSFEQTDKFSTGSLITRVTNDITTVQMTVAMALRMFVRSLSMFILGIVFSIGISPKFMIVIAITLPFELLIMFIFMKKAFPVFSVIQKKLDKINSVLHENLSGARVVKAFSKEEHETKRFIDANEDLLSTTFKVNKWLAFVTPIFMFIIQSAMILIYILGAKTQFEAFKDMIDPEITVGDMQKAITFITLIMSSLLMIGMTLANMARAFASGKRINEVLATPLILVDGNLDTATLEETGTIEFKNVCFSYPNMTENVLEKLNFKIDKGETIAIVGATGSGKSSLVNLITRFYDVTDGEILVDGANVKEYKIKELREKIAIVLQKAELFAGTIKENISWGKPDAKEEEIIKAAQIAQAEEFILSTESGYDEFVEEKGTSLSGGQRQRISIARAIVKQPEIIIFDDSTSALDLLTEAKLYQAMKENIEDITKIVVAQRIATAKNADKIIVLDGGNIIAFDTHENLLQNCSVYKDIHDSQLKKDGE